MAATSGGDNEQGVFADEDPDELARRFPDLNEDERLRAARRALPDPPQRTFTKPTIRQFEPMADSGRFGRGSGMNARDMRGVGLASTVGIQFVSMILAGAGLGWVADQYLLHSKGTPWGIVAGVLLGSVGAFSAVFRLTRQLNDDEQQSSGGNGAGGG